jgi:hypothetical protein
MDGNQLECFGYHEESPCSCAQTIQGNLNTLAGYLVHTLGGPSIVYLESWVRKGKKKKKKTPEFWGAQTNGTKMPQLLCVKKLCFSREIRNWSLLHKLGTQIISGHLYYSCPRAQIVSQQVYQFDLVFEGLQLPYLSLTLGMSRSKSPKWWVQT